MPESFKRALDALDAAKRLGEHRGGTYAIVLSCLTHTAGRREAGRSDMHEQLLATTVNLYPGVIEPVLSGLRLRVRLAQRFEDRALEWR